MSGTSIAPPLDRDARREQYARVADEIRLLANEYDPNNSDWGFRKGVICGLIDRLDALLALDSNDGAANLDQMVGELLAKICSHRTINDAMEVAWDDICTDTGCHPLDITHGKNKHLVFSPNHWASQIAKRLFVSAIKLRLEMLSPKLPHDGAGQRAAVPDTITVPYNPCLAKLRPGEPFFVLLGRDKQAPNAVMTWANDRQAAEGKSAWTEQARDVAYAMASYSGSTPALSVSVRSGDGL